jgi:S1-C subfamily serine protease
MERRKKLLTLFAGLFIFNTEISTAQTSGKTPIANAELYTVRTKASIRYSFYEDDAGSTNGAGFLVDRSLGWILTNAHVSGRGTGDIEVSFKSEPFIPARLIYVDTELDAAIIQVDDKDIPENATEAPLQCENSELNAEKPAVSIFRDM